MFKVCTQATSLLDNLEPHHRNSAPKQFAFDQRDLHLTPAFERTTDLRQQALVSKFGTLDTIIFT